MPGTWSDGDDAGGDDESPLAPPVHPDDRLWRHPSELAWGVPPPTPPGGVPQVPGSPPPAAPTGGRPWGLLVTSGLLGAVVALGTVAFMGGLGTADPERVVERVGVRNELADAFTAFPGQSPPGLPEVVASVSPSVVRIDLPGDADGTGGSGVVVLDDGHILTNAHVVGDAVEVTIVRADGHAVGGRVVGVDAVTDLAVVQPVDDGAGLAWTPAVRGPSGDLRVGDPTVLVAGPGPGGDPTVTLGMVASMARWLRTGDGRMLHNLIETDVVVAPDTSGGALCDRNGRVVGLATGAAGENGSGYATTMDDAWPAAEALIADGEIHHAWLGIQGSDLDATQSSVLGITEPAGGVVLTAVMPESPAEAAGLIVGDVLLAVGEVRITSMSDLVMALRAHQPGDDVAVSVQREGQAIEASITLTERG